MRSVRSLACLAGLLVVVGAPAAARADEWVLLGEKVVDFGADRDVIVVTGAEGTFRKIKLKVTDSPIQMNDLDVHFGNGEKVDVSVRENIEQGGETRVLDLPGEARVIKKIGLGYRTRGRMRGGRAHVKVFGLREGGGEAKRGEKQPVWVKLGERRVKLFGADRDVIPVSAAEGRFRKIKLKVTESGVETLSLKVHFGNGETEDVTLREVIPEGGETRTIDLPGATRVIQKIELVFKTHNKAKGHAFVHVFGLQEDAGGEAPKAAPAAGQWELLGETTVKWRAERDEVMVTASEGRFTKLKLAVKDNGIHLMDLEVHFGNGEKFDVPVRSMIPEGGETRVIDLPGEARVIRKVVFTYQTAGRAREGRAHVRVWGRS